jgi:hypothetical protein
LLPACSRSRSTTEVRPGSQGSFTRLAGSLDLADGAHLTWSVADGSRGRRWRAVSVAKGAITHSVLLEVDLAGRPSRLELATPAGMLTLHPSADQAEIHGNVVRATGEGVRHLAFAWGPQHEIEITGRPGPTVVGLHRRRASVAVGASVEIDVLAIGPGLDVTAGIRRVERLTERRWRIGTSGVEIEIDADGLPVGGVRWALEAG